MQNQIKNFPENPISLAIKLIGVGKRGSRHLSQEIIELVKQEVMSIRKIDTQYAIQLGAFLSVLGIKENDENEEKLFDELLSYFSKKLAGNFSKRDLDNYHFEILASYLFPTSEIKLKDSIVSVFLGNEIRESEFEQIGRLFFTPVPKENEVEVFAARAFVTSIIRYRYTTKEEYFGLYKSFIKELEDKSLFAEKSFSDKIIIISEPFDGVSHSHIITPIITQKFCDMGYIPIVLVSQSPGPKNDLNLNDLIQENWLSIDHLLSQGFVMGKTYFCDLNLHFPIFLEWKLLRKYTLKRPFLSTMERFFNLFQAHSYLGSAFHGNFNEIMMQLAKNIGYRNIQIVRKGREGSLAFSLAKETEVYTAKKGIGNVYVDNFGKIEFKEKEIDDGRVPPDKEKNQQYIRAYLNNEEINEEEYQRFKLRATYTLENISKFFSTI